MYLISLFLFLLIGVLYWKRYIFLLSPVDVFVFFFTGVLISTLLYHEYYPKHEKFNFFGFDLIGRKRFITTFSVYVKMLLLFLTGVFIYLFSNKSYFSLTNKPITIFNSNRLKLDTHLLSRIIIILTVLAVVLVYIDYGTLFFYRVEYIPKKTSILKIIYQNLLIIISVLAGAVYNKNKALGISVLLTALTIGIGIGSRAATIYLVVFGISYSTFLDYKKAKVFYLYFVPLAVVFFGYNISLRLEANGHGLLPYMDVTLKKPEIIFKYVLMNIYYTMIFGFYATSKTIELYTFDSFSTLMTCLNPLPGKMTNWYSIASKLRMNVLAPFTAIGELAQFPLFSYFYYVLLGYYFATIDFFIKRQILQKKYLWAVVQFLLLVLFVVHSFEYNLRSTHRFIYYSLAVYALYFFIKRVKKLLPYKNVN